MSSKDITIVAVEALSYSGTTWLNLVLGSHPRALTLGPPDRVWNLRDKGFEGANLVWGDKDTFWKGFDAHWDRKENFLVALAGYAGVSHIIFDGPSAQFEREVMFHPDLNIIRPLYLRDARAITASHARKFPNESYLESILPSGWFYSSYQGLQLSSTHGPKHVYYYEDCVADPLKFLKTIGPEIGLDYTADALRFWEHDHHITSGNAGTVALLKFAKDLPVGNFESRDFYQAQLDRMTSDYLRGFVDERWKTQLSRLDRFYFDMILGAKHAELGYARDVFEREEIKVLLEEHKARVAQGENVDIPAYISDQYLADAGMTKLSHSRRIRNRIDTLSNRISMALELSLTKAGREAVWRKIQFETEQGAAKLLSGLGRYANTTNRKAPSAGQSLHEVQQRPINTWPSPSIANVLYQDAHDTIRINGLFPYRARRTKQSLDSIKASMNFSFYQAYGPNYTIGSSAKVCVDPLIRYRDLLEFLNGIDNLEFRTARDLVANKPAGNSIYCQIRHDVDGDLVAALAQARLENELSICSTYYILHTAPYYGRWNTGRKYFDRNEAAIEVYREIQSLGHEVALHTDPLQLYQHHGVDGAAAVKTEIEWLRSEGMNITGSAAHNSVGTYGACNYAIFKGRNVAFNQPPGPLGVIKDGKWAPLQVISEKDLALEYEGNDLFWQTETRLEYYCLMSQNWWFYQVFENGRILSKTEEDRRQEWKSQEQVLDEITALGGPRNLMLSVHPMHYGFRSAGTDEPAIQAPDPESTRSMQPGWNRREAGQTVVARAGTKTRAEFEAFSVVNELGALDVPVSHLADKPNKVLILGRDMFVSPSVPVASKASQVAAALLKRNFGSEVGITYTGYAPSTPTLQIAAFHQAFREQEFDLVVFSVGADDIIGCDPELFSEVMGLDQNDRKLLFETPWSEPDLAERVQEAIGKSRSVDMAPFKSEPALGFFTDKSTNAKSREALWKVAEDRLHAAIRHIRDHGAEVILLLEDCGEKAGLWTAQSDSASRCDLAATARTRFSRLAERSNVELVDPYETFNSYSGCFTTHWKAVAHWSIHGHHLASKPLAATIDAAINTKKGKPGEQPMRSLSTLKS